MRNFNLGIIDRHRSGGAVARGDVGKVEESADAPIGKPGQPFDQLIVFGERVVAGRQDPADAAQRERRTKWIVDCVMRAIIKKLLHGCSLAVAMA